MVISGQGILKTLGHQATQRLGIMGQGLAF